MDTAGDSVGAALAVAEHLPLQAGQALGQAARSAYVSGMAPSMLTGAAVAAAGILVSLFLFPRGKESEGPTADTGRLTDVPSQQAGARSHH
jgi:hypothetical protein